MGLLLFAALSVGMMFATPPSPSLTQTPPPAPSVLAQAAPAAQPPADSAPPPANTFEASVPFSNPIVRLRHPNGWRLTPIKRGTESASPDGELFLWFETYLPAEYSTVQREHEAYFRQQGVRLPSEPRRSAGRRNEFITRTTQFDGTWRGKPTHLIYITFELGTALGHQLLLTCWTSPEGLARHDAAMKEIVESIRLAPGR